MKVFVTVGTTKFDHLIYQVFSEDVQKALADRGYTQMKVQFGKSKIEWEVIDFKRLKLTTETYDYKLADDFKKDLRKADLVIGHAGAGTLLDVMNYEKRFIAVVNDELMDNHQIELAYVMSEDKYVFKSSPHELAKTIAEADWASLNRYPNASPEIFPAVVYRLFTGREPKDSYIRRIKRRRN